MMGGGVSKDMCTGGLGESCLPGSCPPWVPVGCWGHHSPPPIWQVSGLSTSSTGARPKQHGGPAGRENGNINILTV